MSNAPATDTIPQEVREAVERAYKAAKDRIESINLNTHYRESIDYLDENFAFFLTHVLNMGKPEWTGALKTAAVALPTNDTELSNFSYLFNPTFAALLEPEEFAFIQAHETMHVLLNHLKLLDTGKKRGKFKNAQKFNVAADCVINDYLLSMGLECGRVRDMACFGEDIVGYNCANATVSEVYIDIPDDQSGGEGGDAGEGVGEGQGGLGEYMQGTSKSGATGDHDWMHNPQQGQAKAADKIGEQTPGVPQDIEDKKQDDDNKGTPGAGPGSEAGAMRHFVEEKGVSMKWAELLKEVNPDFFKKFGPRPRPSYHKPRRKMMGVYEQYRDMGTLPVQRDPDLHKGETPSIVMFMDGSGSCYDWIDRFCTLAKSVPPTKIHLTPFSFSTYVIPFDVTGKDKKIASGGTAFSPIEETIRNVVVPDLGHYPKAVVVLTDGEGHFSGIKPEKQNEDKWLWLMTHNARYASYYGPFPGRTISIDKFCEGMPNMKK